MNSKTKWQVHSPWELNDHWVDLLKIAPGWCWKDKLSSLLISRFWIFLIYSIHSFIYSLISIFRDFLLLYPIQPSMHLSRNFLVFHRRWNPHCKAPHFPKAKSSSLKWMCSVASSQLLTAEFFHKDKGPAGLQTPFNTTTSPGNHIHLWHTLTVGN